MKTLVFAGAGLSTLSLLMRLLQNGVADKVRIQVYERSDKNQNDRTWCFWEKGQGFFDELVAARWNQLDFFSNGYAGSLDMGGYEYKMIRGIDFYRHCLSALRTHPKIDWHQTEIETITAQNGAVELRLAGGDIHRYEDAVGFNSIPRAAGRQPGDIILLQHFKGWRIRTNNGAFDPTRATLMDFRISQEPGTSFVYLLPFSDNEALVEYTLFTGELLKPEAYETMLYEYCDRFLGLGNFEIVEEEFGIIPMTNLVYPPLVDGILQLGTAGGRTKASSGYTFQFVQKQSDQLAAQLAQDKARVHTEPEKWRFRFYDHTLLQVLHDRLMPGDAVFSRLFEKNPTHRVFRFLDNETSLGEELRILTSLPSIPFIKAAIRKRRTY